MTTSRGQFFRANVGIAVLSSQATVLALERFDIPGAWQLPQGGLDEGEEPLEAAQRELREETGLESSQVKFLGEHPRWLAYELAPEWRRPDTGRGQVQKWFAVRLVDAQAEIEISHVDERKGHPEFRAHAWMPLDELLAATPAFRRVVYEPLADWLRAAGWAE